MVGIQGLGGVPEPKSGRPAKVREERETRSAESASAASGSGSAQDDVVISSEAKAAAEVARVALMTKTEDVVRSEKVEAARASIERGDYKKPEVVNQVAQKVMKYLA